MEDPEVKIIIERGDIVQLASGGPHMTVEAVNEDKDEVACVWFVNDDSGPHRAVFSAAILNYIEED